MLSHHPRTQLCFVIQQYGQTIITEPKRCKGLLSDLAPEHRLEVNLLISALEQNVSQELLQPSALIPINIQLDRLAKHLHDVIGMKEDFAYWAVESWALTLNVIQQPMPNQTTQAIAKPQAMPPPKVAVTHLPAQKQISSNWGAWVFGIGGTVSFLVFIGFSSMPTTNTSPSTVTSEAAQVASQDTFQHAENLRKQGLYVEALPFYQILAKQGNALALGVMYKYGEGVVQDFKQAGYWFRKAAEQGDSRAQYELGIMYDNGNGVVKDYTQAVYWYSKAAEQGNTNAIAALKLLRQ